MPIVRARWTTKHGPCVARMKKKTQIWKWRGTGCCGKMHFSDDHKSRYLKIYLHVRSAIGRQMIIASPRIPNVWPSHLSRNSAWGMVMHLDFTRGCGHLRQVLYLYQEIHGRNSQGRERWWRLWCTAPLTQNRWQQPMYYQSSLGYSTHWYQQLVERLPTMATFSEWSGS